MMCGKIGFELASLWLQPPAIQPGMVGCMDRWMDGWLSGWMDGWMDGCIDAWMHGCMDASMHGCIDVWMHGSRDQRERERVTTLKRPDCPVGFSGPGTA